MITKDRAIKILAGVSIGLLVIGGGIAYKGYKDMNDPEQIELNRVNADQQIGVYGDSIEELNSDIIVAPGYDKSSYVNAEEYKIIIYVDQSVYTILSDPNYKTIYNNCRIYAENILKENHVKNIVLKVELVDENYKTIYGEY